MFLARAIVVAFVAMPALAGLLIVVGFGAIKPSRVYSVVKSGPLPTAIMAVTFGLTLVIPLQFAVLAGVGLGIILYVAQQSNRVRVRAVHIADGGRMRESDPPPPSRRGRGARAAAVRQPLLRERSDLREAAARGEPRVAGAVVIVRLRGTDQIGLSLVDVLRRFAHELRDAESRLKVVATEERVIDQLEAGGLTADIGERNVYSGTEWVGETLRRALRRRAGGDRRGRDARSGALPRHPLSGKLEPTRLKFRRAEADFRRHMNATQQPGQEEPQSALEQFGINLTDRARQGKLDPVIGRDSEIRRVSQVLTRRTKNNPVLIGEPGVGKTAVVEGLAQRIVAGDVAESLKDKELVTLDISALVAGAMYRGQFEERLKGVLKEITESDGRIITFIDELHVLMGAGGGEGSVAASNMLKPMLARGELRMIGATTLNEYREFIEKDAALERRFQQVYVGEPTVEDTVAILRGLKERYEAHHKVAIADAALVAAASLSHRYIPSRQLPDKAIDLIDEAASRLRMEIDSAPLEIDELRRHVDRLKLEELALKKEKDDASKERLAALRETARRRSRSASASCRPGGSASARR